MMLPTSMLLGSIIRDLGKFFIRDGLLVKEVSLSIALLFSAVTTYKKLKQKCTQPFKRFHCYCLLLFYYSIFFSVTYCQSKY